VLCGGDKKCLKQSPSQGRQVRRENRPPFRFDYWVANVGTGTKLFGSVQQLLPPNQNDVVAGTVGWACNKWQDTRISAVHADRGGRQPNAAAGLDTLLNEGGDRLRSEQAATQRRVNEALVRLHFFATSSYIQLPRHSVPRTRLGTTQ
jgi:hypothetical protein